MVKEGEFIDYASNLTVNAHPTHVQISIELAKKIKELEARIEALEKKVKD